MNKRNFFKKAAAFLFAPSMFLMSLCGYYSKTLPDSFYTYEVSNFNVPTAFETSIEYYSDDFQSVYGSSNSIDFDAQIKLLGCIPVKNVNVEAVDKTYVVAGGQPFGIKILASGVMVVSTCKIDGTSPADECGLQKGDIITEIDNESVTTNDELQEIIEESGGNTLELSVLRDEEELILDLTPVYSEDEEKYCAGIWVRDSSAGIGTVTYYDPESCCFGGLGHAVCDSDTEIIVPLLSGKVTGVEIFGVKKSVIGSPGELQGRFKNENICGKITENNSYGVFGILSEYNSGNALVEVALKQEVKRGKAKMLTTINGDEPQEYDIMIESVDYSSADGLKSITIKVTDEELLEKCGGIVQGMSGSPIIQNGKLVAAVTHVFVNDPSCGYAVFAETMIDSTK